VLLWVDAADYAGVKFSMNERIYKTLPERGLNFPYPHLDVNVINK
jgi:small conductance mechanosensitive channel